MGATQHVTVVTDLGFGDAGKGSTTDYLARAEGASAVVRFNGGAQAGHNVVTADGRHHTFNQFGSASFVPGVTTHLSRFMMVNPFRMWQEAERLVIQGVSDAIDRVTIDEHAFITTYYQEAANRIREALRGDGKHGSCGLGIGETMSDSIEHPDLALTAADLANPAQTHRKLEALRAMKLDELESEFGKLNTNSLVAHDIESLLDEEFTDEIVAFYTHFLGHIRLVDDSYLATLLRDNWHVVFEGAQGVLLDEWYGFHPYTTWSTTTNANADLLLREADYSGEVTRLGLLRAYATRHGAGPFVTEDARLTVELTDPHNPHNAWQEGFRAGHFDYVMARYALDVVGAIDGLVISNIDRLVGQPELLACDAYKTSYGETIRRIKPSPIPDLDYQSELTQTLLDAEPILEPVFEGVVSSDGIHKMMQLYDIERALGKPVVLVSSGPTAEDKRAIPL